MYNPWPLVRLELTLLNEKTSPSVLHYTKEAYLETIHLFLNISSL